MTELPVASSGSELSKAEQKLIEKIAKLFCEQDGLKWEWLELQRRWEGEKDCQSYIEKAKQFLTLIKEAGYVLPNSIGTLSPDELLHKWAKDNGYVQLPARGGVK